MSTRQTIPTGSKWSKPPASHAKSRLLQLPAELQLMILRELLITDKPIHYREYYTVSTYTNTSSTLRRTTRSTRNPFATPKVKEQVKKVTGYRLYPQILKTCQAFCAMGTPILYGENTLQIELDTGNDIPCSCEYHCHKLAVAVVLASNKVQLASVQPRHSGGDDLLSISSETLIFATKFSKYYLKSYQEGFYSPDGFPSAAGVFRLLVSADIGSVVLGKDVIVNVNSRCGTEPPQDLDEVKIANGLKAFQSLRCKSFKFEQKVGDAKVYEMVEGVVKGSTPVIDFRTAFKNVQAFKVPLLSMVRTNGGRSYPLENKYNKLADAMYAYDTHTFAEIRKELINTFKKETRKLRSRFEGDEGLVSNAAKQGKVQDIVGNDETAQ